MTFYSVLIVFGWTFDHVFDHGLVDLAKLKSPRFKKKEELASTD
jgi:hypothetical protein